MMCQCHDVTMARGADVPNTRMDTGAIEHEDAGEATAKIDGTTS